MAEFLLELLSEEIPARMQARAAEDLRRLIVDGLNKAGLAHGEAKAYATPRRLALTVDGLPEKQPDVTEEKKGPKVGAPEQAIAGFLKANGLASVDDAVLRETDKGQFYFSVKEIKGRATAVVLPEILNGALAALPWPKSMRWAKSRFRWVRPLQSILAHFDGAVLEGGFEIGNGETLVFCGTTLGHRFLAPDRFTVTSFTDYRGKLHEAQVMLDPAERRASIIAQIDELTEAAGLSVKDDPALLDEVTGLVEWPVVLLGAIDDSFMDLPPEVLTTAMRSHQKYFAVLDKAGDLANRFLVVANMESADGGMAIVAGNERVLRARLADARFFWNQDRKQKLADRAPALADIVFQDRLGNLDQKIDRVEALAAQIAEHVPGADKDRARSAARLAKADLVTGMVSEFPELQGIMGRYYALHDGEHADVAEAIAEHYSPLGPNDACPAAPVSVCVALADKIDTLVGFFAIDEKPTGSKDPFALRRAALGVIRLIVENKLRLPLTVTFDQARKLYRILDGQPSTGALLDFFADRFKVVLKGLGMRDDLVSSLFPMKQAEEEAKGMKLAFVDLARILEKAKALRVFLETDDGANLLIAYRRAANIVKIEGKKDKKEYPGRPLEECLKEDEEKALYHTLHKIRDRNKRLLSDDRFEEALSELASLRRPVDAFFNEVLVNCEEKELRENRLELLANVQWEMGHIADFSKIEG